MQQAAKYAAVKKVRGPRMSKVRSPDVRTKRGLPPMHPGELLREEILPTLDRSKTEIAKLLGVSRQTLYDIRAEKQPVTPAMALRLGKLCGNGPDLWLNLQKRYDLHHAQQELGETIKKIPTLEVA